MHDQGCCGTAPEDQHTAEQDQDSLEELSEGKFWILKARQHITHESQTQSVTLLVCAELHDQGRGCTAPENQHAAEQDLNTTGKACSISGCGNTVQDDIKLFNSRARCLSAELHDQGSGGTAPEDQHAAEQNKPLMGQLWRGTFDPQSVATHDT